VVWLRLTPPPAPPDWRARETSASAADCCH
jgi:hypothetical protein